MFQGGLDTSAKMVMTLQKFCEHVNETSWIMWTYVQDELFLPMRQFLRQDVGTSVRQFFYSATLLQSAVDATALYLSVRLSVARLCRTCTVKPCIIISLVSVARLQASQAASAALAVMRCLSLVSASVALPMALYKYVYDYDYD